MHTSTAIVCTQLDSFSYCYQTLIILICINDLFAYIWFQVLFLNTYNLIWYQWFLIDMIIRVFTNGSGHLGSILDRVIPKTQKWYLMPPCLSLSIMRCGSRVKCSNPGKEWRPPLHLGVVAIEKGDFGSPST